MAERLEESSPSLTAPAPGPEVAIRTERGERRRELILAAAANVFSERGYHAASIAEIAERAEIAKSVIYDHFSSKKELHRALVETESEALIMHVAKAVPAPGTATNEERLRVGIGAFFRYVVERPATWRLLVRDAPAEPDLLDVHVRVQREATKALSHLICPELPEDEEALRHEEMLAELLKTSILGLARWWLDHPEVPRDQLVETVMAFAWTGLQSRP